MQKVINPIASTTISAVGLLLLRQGVYGMIAHWAFATAVWHLSAVAGTPSDRCMQDGAKSGKAIELALPYLAKESASLIDQRGCVSCHHVTFMIWSHNAAVARDLEVDPQQLDSTTIWAIASMLSDRFEFGGADTISQMLLGRD